MIVVPIAPDAVAEIDCAISDPLFPVVHEQLTMAYFRNIRTRATVPHGTTTIEGIRVTVQPLPCQRTTTFPRTDANSSTARS